MHASYKLRLLTREKWDARLESAKVRLEGLFSDARTPEETLSEFSIFEPSLKGSGFGTITVDNEDDYALQINQILSTLVALPARESPQNRSTRINAEIAGMLRKANVLAVDGEGIDNRKVVRDFEIGASEGIKADFALRNGVIHVVATLDLRWRNANLGTAALKSIVLDKASKKYGPGKVKRFGAYAVDPEMRNGFEQHLNLLGDYAHDGLWDWSDRNDQKKNAKKHF